jgi:hypothetical protein
MVLYKMGYPKMGTLYWQTKRDRVGILAENIPNRIFEDAAQITYGVFVYAVVGVTLHVTPQGLRGFEHGLGELPTVADAGGDGEIFYPFGGGGSLEEEGSGLVQ